jgi:hypothetical protein
MQSDPAADQIGNRRRGCRNLVLALEHVRTRLAVAVAAETKRTPAGKWRTYVDLEDEARRRLKTLRTLRTVAEGIPCDCALRMLRELLAPAAQNERLREAQRLSEGLKAVLAHLDESASNGCAISSGSSG